MKTTPKIKVIADSSSTRTEWCLIDNHEILAHAVTTGLNPMFLTRREISHIIRLELPKEFFHRRWDIIHFYGAGCSSPEKIKIVEASLVAQFKTPADVESDMLGAARGLLLDQPGLACILGTGSNSCQYDGAAIVKRVRAGGFILGDEGGGSALGRLFIGDLIKDLAPRQLIEEFEMQFNLTIDGIMDQVYNNPYANRNLRNYSLFLAEHIDNDYVRTLVTNEIDRFFVRHICQYDYKELPVCFVGTIATKFSEILLQVAERYDVKVKKIVSNSMPGLVSFHQMN